MKAYNKLWKRIFIFLLVVVISFTIQKIQIWNRYKIGMTVADVIELTDGKYPVEQYLTATLDKTDPLYYIYDFTNGIALSFDYYGRLIQIDKENVISFCGMRIEFKVLPLGKTLFEKYSIEIKSHENINYIIYPSFY